jgi:inner membrane protein
LALYGLFTLLRFWMRRNSPTAETALESAEDGDPCSEIAVPRLSPPTIAQGAEEISRTFGSIPLHCLIVVLLTLGLLVPLAFVTGLVKERSSMQRSAVKDISEHWGKTQKVRGPVLVIPFIRKYVSHTEKENGKKVVNETLEREYRILLPTTVEFSSEIAPQTRARGIYQYVVYTSPITVAGTFQIPKNAAEFGENVHRVEWADAWFAAGVADLKAIASIDALVWNGQPAAPYRPGTEIGNILLSGFHAPLALDPVKDAGAKRNFSFSAVIKGSGGIYFTPVGENTRITLAAAWAHPKFSGEILPKEYTIDDSAGRFSAVWDIPHLSRTYPQASNASVKDLTNRGHELARLADFTVGVELFEPVSLYTQIERAVKYAILFIGLTFVALLSFELVSRKRLHFMQYCLVGVAMVLFSLVLLSLAEHTSFLNAFLAASGISIVMNSLYMTAALKSLARGGILATLLASLYAILYAILQIEEYALLVGTALLVLVVGVLMFLTRNLSGAKTT